MVEAILVVQLTFPHHIAGALVLDMALAAAERDDVAAFSEVGHGDQTDSGAEARDVEHVGDMEAVQVYGADPGDLQLPPVACTYPVRGGSDEHSDRLQDRDVADDVVGGS